MISLRLFESPEWKIPEIARYAGIRKTDESFRGLIEKCIAEAEPTLSYRVCYTFLDVARDKGTLTFGGVSAKSNTLDKALKNADRLLLFAASVGAPFDRLIQRYSRIEPSKALIMQAIGAERVESLCDVFCASINSELCKDGKRLTTRVSPGYGDISLELQRDIFAVLDCPRKIGLTLDESLLMSPSKSVTALCGVVDSAEKPAGNKCAACDKTDCRFRNQNKISV